MSDSDNNRRRQMGRGSLLDFVARQPDGQAGKPAGRTARNVQRSLLSAQSGSPRLSTSHAVKAHSGQTSSAIASAKTANNHGPMSNASSRVDDAKRPGRGFGAHIAGLVDRFKPDTDRPFTSDARKAEAPLEIDEGMTRYASVHQHVPEDGDDGEKPLIDLSILVGAVWRFRRFIVAATFLGAVAGVLIALSTPHKYYAETRLFIDPREIRLTEDELRSPLMSTEAMIAMTDSQAAILTSTNVLIQVVDELNLARDPEFNGSLNAGGISGGIALIKQLITGKDANSEAETEALSNLRDALNVDRDPKTFVINIGITSRDPEKSAVIANAIVRTYLESEGEAQSGLMERTSEAIDSRLETLRSDLNAAERAVENFKAENDLVSVGTELIDDQQITAINQQLANARSTKVSVGVKAEGLKRADVADVIDGAFPEEFLSANLIELRKQYSQSKANADSLSSRLGPRHPQFIAANSSLESIKTQIRSELRRIVASSQSELQRAIETEQELAAQLAVAKTRSLENSEDLVTLRELERKAAATRQIYEAFLKRSREASERGNFNTQNARVISPAEAPLQPDSTSRKVIAIGGMVIGAILGLGIAILAGILESIRSFLPGPGGGRRPRPSRQQFAPDMAQRREYFGAADRPEPVSPSPQVRAEQSASSADPDGIEPDETNAPSKADQNDNNNAGGRTATSAAATRDTGKDHMNHFDPAFAYLHPASQGFHPHQAHPAHPQPMHGPVAHYPVAPYPVSHYPAAHYPAAPHPAYPAQAAAIPPQPYSPWPSHAQQPAPVFHPSAPVAQSPVAAHGQYGHPGYYQPTANPVGWPPHVQQHPASHSHAGIQPGIGAYPQPSAPQTHQNPQQVPGAQFGPADAHGGAAGGQPPATSASEAEIHEIRRQMDNLRQRIGRKNRSRAG